MDFYVYEHIRKDTNTVFYVGKGRRYRAWDIHGRSKHWKNIVNKAKGFEVKIIAEALDEKTALNIEIERIAHLKNSGFKLSNKTIGGEGASGYKWTVKDKQNHYMKRPEQREKRAFEMKINNPMKNPKAVEKMKQTKRGMNSGDKHFRAKEVWHEGKRYPTIKSLALYLGIGQALLGRRIKKDPINFSTVVPKRKNNV